MSADLDEPLALELREADPHRRLRDAEPLGEVALDERRPLRQLPADDQLAQRRRRRAASTDSRLIGSISVDGCMLARPRFEISYRDPTA